jgi:hypothetical protein
MKNFIQGFCCLLVFCLYPGQVRSENTRVRIEMVRNSPELRVDGRPFFIHSAAFFYSRLPRDQWETSLRRHAELGINTLDLYLQWNWHEPEEGRFDFDGHTNPRRDLKGLLHLISKMGFKLIVRPGPVILNEWKNGGYPDWLLTRAEYQESLQDVLEGRYPRLSGLSTSQSEEASRQWLANATHLQYTRLWFFEVMKVLSPYLPSRGGNILFFQLDDDQAINRTNYNGPIFWRYMNRLRQDLEEAALSVGGEPADILPFINPTDMRVSAAGFDPSFSKPIAAMGQWYMNSSSEALNFEETATLQFYVEELKTQPAFPPMIIEFQAGWYVPGDDQYAKRSDPSNTLLASRTLLAHGLRGLNYFPLQDTLYPAGYEVPWTNHYYTWDAALDLNSDEQMRAQSVRRNGNLIRGMGELLAQTRKQADVGIVYALGGFQPQEKLSKEEVRAVSSQVLALQQALMQARVTNEYLDPEYQPLEQLKRHKLLLMPIHRMSSGRNIALSRTTEERLIQYVNSGGILAFFPRAPETGLLAEWFSGIQRNVAQGGTDQTVCFLSQKPAEFRVSGGIESYGLSTAFSPTVGNFETIARARNRENSSAVGLERRVGNGRIIVLGWDFFSGISTKPEKTANAISLPPNEHRKDSLAADLSEINTVVEELLARGNVSRAIHWSDAAEPGKERMVDVQLEAANACSGFGFVSLVNFSGDSEREIKVSVSRPEDCIPATELPTVRILPKDALLLPLRLPLKAFLFGETDAELVASNAELFLVEGEDQHFRLGFHAPLPSEVILKLENPERYQFKSQGVELKPVMDREHGWIRVAFPGGEGALSIRFLNVEMREVPVGSVKKSRANTVKEETKAVSNLPGGVPAEDEVQVTLSSAYTLPIRGQLTLDLSPPVLALDNKGPARVVLDLNNRTSREVKYSLEFHVNGYRLQPSLKVLRIRPFSKEAFEFNLDLFLESPMDSKVKFVPGKVLLKSRHKTIERGFYLLALDPGTAKAYALDLDRDGFPEVVLENSELRLVITPHAGARSFVLIDKAAKRNIFTSVGALRDRFQFSFNQASWTLPRQVRGYFGLHNRPYQFEILDTGDSKATVRLFYEAPDVAPSGAFIEKIITLHDSQRYFDVEYRVTPHEVSQTTPQAFISSNYITRVSGEEGPPLILVPVGSTGPLVLRSQSILKDGTTEMLMEFKPFDQTVATYSYTVRYELAPPRRQ